MQRIVQPRRSWRKRLIALAVSFTVSLLLAELVVRALFGVPLAERLPLAQVRAHAIRGWEMVPDHVHYTYEYPVQVNSWGLRGRELGAKQPGEIRVLVLGDSLVYGQGVADDGTLPVALEEALLRRCPSHVWTVVNGGLRAYDTFQELALLEELGPRIGPDIVVLGWYWNDLFPSNVAASYNRLKDRGVVAFDTGRPMTGWPLYKWHGQQLLRHSTLLMLAHDVVKPVGGVLDDANMKTGLERLAGHLQQLRELGRNGGFEVVFTVLPDANVVSGHAKAALLRRAADGALAVAREQGLPTIDPLSAVQALYAAKQQLPVVPFDGHYDGTANRAMADLMAEQLLLLGVTKRIESRQR